MTGFTVRKACGIRVLAVAAVLAILVLPASAAVYDIDKDPDGILYGNLNQIHVPGIGPVACGPTAAVNSFVYLENKYPCVYDNLLVPAGSAPPGVDYNGDGITGRYEDMATVAATLGGLMGTAPPGGTYDDMFIYGKYAYLEQVAPGLTTYAAQMAGTWGWQGRPVVPPIAKPDWVADGTIPTWQFLWDNLVACEDVEILIVDYDWGHFLTLSSLFWNDANNDLIMDIEEAAVIDYIDPWTGAKGFSPIWQYGLNSQLFVGYGDYPAAQLVMAVKESPVPEPATFIIWSLLGGFGIAMGWWRKRKAA